MSIQLRTQIDALRDGGIKQGEKSSATAEGLKKIEEELFRLGKLADSFSAFISGGGGGGGANSTTQALTLTANVNPFNGPGISSDGDLFCLILTQGGSGNYTVTPGGDFDTTIRFVFTLIRRPVGQRSTLTFTSVGGKWFIFAEPHFR